MRHNWRRGKFRQKKRSDGMNKTEAAYAELLTARQLAGEVAGWMYEAVTLKLANDTRYTPDFLVQMADGSVEFHEVKACRASGAFLAEDDARVKFKVAGEQFPIFVFRMCGLLPRKSGGGWRVETYGE